MRVVVTGALGYIGSRLIRDLAYASPGCEIVLLDNLASERYASLYDLPGRAHYYFIEADVLTADLRRIVSGADAVVHLAAITNGPDAALLERMRRVNLDGAELVARACAANHVPLLFPSTTSVYGVPYGVVNENCLPADLRPQSPYAGWKLQAEQLLESLGRDQGLDFVILRMATIFGPSIGMRFHTAVNRFCWRAATGQPIEVWKTAPHQFRPYLDLTDAVRAMIFLLRRRQFDRRIYNLLTLNATVAHVVEVLTWFMPELRVSYVDSPLMNTLSYCVDQQRLTRLGFEPGGSLQQGIANTIEMVTGRTVNGPIMSHRPR